MKKILLTLVLLSGTFAFAMPEFDYTVGGAEFQLLRDQAFEKENFTSNMELIKQDKKKEYLQSIPTYDTSKIKKGTKIDINSSNDLQFKNNNGTILIEKK